MNSYPFDEAARVAIVELQKNQQQTNSKKFLESKQSHHVSYFLKKLLENVTENNQGRRI